MNDITSQRGASLLAAIFLIVAVAFFGLIVVSLISTQSFTAQNEAWSTQALYVADGGLERALYAYRNGAPCNTLVYAAVSLGSGNFTTTGTLYNPTATTLSIPGIDNVQTTIPVASTVGYAPHGRIRIESEEITYAAISGNTFTGARRGTAGTVAAAHVTGVTVSQNQCVVRSTGDVPGTVGSGQRVVETAEGGVSSSQGSFTKQNGVGNQVITGVGFRPKAVIFYWTRHTAVPPAVSPFAGQNSMNNLGVGFASGPANVGAVSITARDRRPKSDNGRMRSQTYPIIFLTGGGGGGQPTVVARAQLVSLDADGFTINWTTNTDSNPYLVHYVALGGDITNALASTFNLTTAAGNQTVAGVGFQPDFVLFLWSFTEAVDTAGIGNSEIGLGLAAGPTSRGAIVYSGRDNSGTNVDKNWQQRTDSAILLLDPTTSPPSQDAIANFVSMDANGFTVNKSDPPAASTPIFFLALRGGRHRVDAFNQATAVGNQAIAGVGFKPQQLVMASFNLLATPAVSSGGGLSYGAAQLPAVSGAIWLQDRSDNDPSDANMYTATTDAMMMAYGTAVGNVDGDPVTRARANLFSWDADGFTLNWTAASAPSRQVLYWAIGPNVAVSRVDWQGLY